jgi:NADH-quinone oxidoreductase subunit A
MTLEYIQIALFLGVGLILSTLLIALSYFLGTKKGDVEKLSPYECGFQPFEDARQEFDVRFYVVALLFLILDLEMVYLFPWSVVLHELTWEGYWSMILFLFLLTLGFVYEWVKGALNW